MAAKVIVPKLGMSNEPIMLIEWKVQEGGKVEKGSVVLVVETEKIRNDVEAETSGYLHILMEAGKEAPIGSVAGVIAESKEELASLGGAPSAGPAKAAAPGAPVAKTASTEEIITSAAKVIVPKLGMSNEPIMLIEWKAKEGGKVEKGSVVLVVETEKIRNDVEAETSGYLHILMEAGKEAPIGSAAGVIVASQADLAVLQGGAAPAAKTAAPVAAPAAAEEQLRISPVARKLAEEQMIDIARVAGSGPEGRITREDIEREIAKKAAPGGAPVSVPPEAAAGGRKAKTTIPLTGLRKAIADHMVRSLTTAAQLTVMGELEVTQLVKFREKLVAKESELGVRITYTDLMVGLVARLLRDYPLMNASLVGNEIKAWDDINVSVAVALEEGLIVPVVRNADKKSLVEISKEVKSLAKKARERTLAPTDVQGGTFTITNLGAMGGGYRFETVIINQPESAIMGMGEITDRAVVREKQVVIRPIMTYYLTYDHRVMTGAVGAAFITSLVKLLENPEANLKVK